MVNKDVWDSLAIDDLQPQHKSIAETLGLDVLRKLSESYGGTQMYVPMPFELAKEAIYKRINNEFDGDNVPKLAVKYRVSESTVYRVVKERVAELKYAPLEGQLSLVDL